MKKCRHENVNPYVWRESQTVGWGWFLARVLEEPGAKRCMNCGAWLSLGESNDEPEAVRVEMRAAEIRGPEDLNSYDERMGWGCHAGHDHDANIPRDDREWAAWLAREIFTHEETP